MKIKFDSTQFDRTFRLFEFAEVFRKRHHIKESVKNVEVSGGKTLFIYFPREAHRLDPNDLAEEIGCAFAIIGLDSAQDYVICGIRGERL